MICSQALMILFLSSPCQDSGGGSMDMGQEGDELLTIQRPRWFFGHGVGARRIHLLAAAGVPWAFGWRLWTTSGYGSSGVEDLLPMKTLSHS